MRKAMETKTEGNTGEHTEGLKQLDETALNNPELVAGVEEKLADTFGSKEERLTNLNKVTKDDPADEIDETEDSTSDVTDDSKVEDDNQTVSDDGSDDSTPEVDEDGKGSKGGTVTIPDAFVRAAIHQGWKQEDVDDLIEKQPDLALTALSNLYNSTINASKDWSALGRARIEQERAAAEADTVEQTSPSMTPSEIKKLKEDYSDDPAVMKLVTNVEQEAARPKPKVNVEQPVDRYATATARANAAANASIDARVDTFFSSDALTPYEEYYGKLKLSQTVNDLTNGQQEHRLAVLEEGECIMTGKRMRNLNPTVEEVLAEAHLVVTEPIREQVIRNNLKKSATKRKKSMTFRPSKSKKSSNASTSSQKKPQNRQEIITRAEQRLASTPGLR